ncbi:hypothetical protein WG909_05325 [Peptostreptococcaceae bacterium AGR-M142]
MNKKIVINTIAITVIGICIYNAINKTNAGISLILVLFAILSIGYLRK